MGRRIVGNLSEEDYLASASAVAQDFSAQGGLMSKVWLERPEDGTYGAVYLWRDREAMERFLRTPLFEGNNSERLGESQLVRLTGCSSWPVDATTATQSCCWASL